jgi:ribosomal protein S17
MKSESKKKHEKESGPEHRSKDNDSQVLARGRVFQGKVVSKFPKRVAIEFERIVRVPKYERFYKKKTRLHARLPAEFESHVNVGDYIKIQECRPLSKIIHHIVIGKVKSSDNSQGKEAKAK